MWPKKREKRPKPESHLGSHVIKKEMRRRFYISFSPNNSFFQTQTVKATRLFFSPAAKHVPKIPVLLLLNRKHKLFQVIWANLPWGVYLVHQDVRLYFPLIFNLAQATAVSGQFNPSSPLRIRRTLLRVLCWFACSASAIWSCERVIDRSETSRTARQIIRAV